MNKKMWPFKICFGLPDESLTISAWEIQTMSIISMLKRKTNSREKEISEYEKEIQIMEDLRCFLTDEDTTPLLDKNQRLVHSHVVEAVLKDIEENKILFEEDSVKNLLRDIRKSCATKKSQINEDE